MDTIEVSCRVRKAVVLQVPIKNPLSENVRFDIEYGSSELVGPLFLLLKGKESALFEFYYSPLLEQDSQAVVKFSSFKASCF